MTWKVLIIALSAAAALCVDVGVQPDRQDQFVLAAVPTTFW